MEKNRTDPGLHRWFIPVIRPGFAVDSMPITVSEVFSIFLCNIGVTPIVA
jgi:hypothetical protein